MSKKKFSSGLDLLFDPKSEEVVSNSDSFLEEKEKPSGFRSRIKSRKKSFSKKNFTSDLDSLLNEVIEEKVEEKVAKIKDKDSKAEKERKIRRRFNAPIKGLNALIRQTVDKDLIDIQKDKRRVTFSYDRTEYQKLKKLAKHKRAYLKDILSKIISDYIQEYEMEHGVI